MRCNCKDCAPPTLFDAIERDLTTPLMDALLAVLLIGVLVVGVWIGAAW